MNPAASIVPLLGVPPPGARRRFLGTGTFVAPSGYLVTAEHVVRDWTEAFAVTTIIDTTRLYSAEVVLVDREVDIAVLRVRDYNPPHLFSLLADDNAIYPNESVVCYEYGTCNQVGETIQYSAATRLGNVTRVLISEPQYGLAGKDMLELSFPALRGASGAPVLSNRNQEVWGIVVANISYHLLPAQIESVLSLDGKIEETTSFMLPQAVAVHVKHLRTLLQKLSA